VLFIVSGEALAVQISSSSHVYPVLVSRKEEEMPLRLSGISSSFLLTL
jgi:hypothetical protein